MEGSTTWLDYATAFGTTGGALAAALAAWHARRAATETARSAQATAQSAKATADIARVERERWEQERVERATANLSVRVPPEPRPRHDNTGRVLVINRGPGHAYEVDVELQPPSPSAENRHPRLTARILADVTTGLPVPVVSPGEDVEVAVEKYRWVPPPHVVQVVVRWSDGRDEEQRHEMTRVVQL